MSGFDTIWPADSAEFCPHPDRHNIFVCGTYKLEQPMPALEEVDDHADPSDTSFVKKSQTRRGKCLLFRADSDGRPNLLQETELPAILDMKWCHRTSHVLPLLAIADSEGHITLHQLEKGTARLTQIQSIACAASDVLCLSLDWSNRRMPADGMGKLVVSLSNGSLSLLSPSAAELVVTDSWHAHDYEPWIAAWNYWDTNVVYSGGDDLQMKGWDIRQGGAQPTFTNKRFDAGVTTIQSHPFVEHLMAVGSYDNTVRLFDTRKPLVPLTQVDVGGGAWRVKWHPTPARKNDLLVACMHDGFKVVRFELIGEDPVQPLSSEIIKRFNEHTSLAYGVDWSFADAVDDGTLVASASFYDQMLHVWRA
ncbi:WD-40 repeat-containing protein [Epithele typhae]|uniref:WD-40 repeat-containing protein n=1 Tax=Epithele typhae TaxID=378194 RepID=UPI0020086DFC|nr:WD-40 repeat-containing protein [Epithele typhae]KAH9944379.1 WD-40 repeat-containing protein [Epithele typhae]